MSYYQEHQEQSRTLRTLPKDIHSLRLSLKHHNFIKIGFGSKLKP